MMKKFDSYKKCVIETCNETYSQFFHVDWSFTAIKDWMFDTFSIDIDTVIQIEISSVSLYKNKLK